MNIVRLISDNDKTDTSSTFRVMIGDVEIPNIISVDIDKIECGRLLQATIVVSVALGGKQVKGEKNE